MSLWYKIWFESDYYLSLYKHRDDRDALRLFELIISNTNPLNKKLLDVACGTGRHSVLFAEKGYDVTAFDLSKNLLRIARNRSIESGFNLKLFCADVRELALKQKFSIIINLFTSFGYFENDEENFRLFNNAYKYLSHGGNFVFDYFNVNYLKSNLVPESIDKYEDKIYTQKRYFKGDRINKDIIINNGTGEKFFQESVKLYCPDRIQSELELKGFLIKNIFGNYMGSNFDMQSSPRLIIIAEK